jgi:hypothetical protein
VLVDLSLVDVVLGAVAVVADVAAVCAETWMANMMVIARSMKRRDMVRKAISACEIQEEVTVNLHVFWTLRTTKKERVPGRSWKSTYKCWNLAVIPLQSRPRLAATNPSQTAASRTNYSSKSPYMETSSPKVDKAL